MAEEELYEVAILTPKGIETIEKAMWEQREWLYYIKKMGLNWAAPISSEVSVGTIKIEVYRGLSHSPPFIQRYAGPEFARTNRRTPMQLLVNLEQQWATKRVLIRLRPSIWTAALHVGCRNQERYGFILNVWVCKTSMLTSDTRLVVDMHLPLTFD
ncbi:hypothetical protein PQX77_002004 [Marasmius sp. AFHP31]|nr:hypothetical protein PQX77_002004 [Marasmius sp. AFHP31]